MAKKISKGTKRFMSIIFHLVVLIVMVNLYDAGRAMLGKEKPKLPPPAPKQEVKAQSPGSNKSGDGSFEKLMAEKQRKARQGPEIPEPEKKEEKEK